MRQNPPIVLRSELAEWVDPAAAFQALHGGSAHAFWLDCGPDAVAGVSYMGAPRLGSRVVTASVLSDTVDVRRVGSHEPAAMVDGTVFDFLRTELPAADRRSAPTGESARFELGWVGWLGYELGAQTVGTPTHPSPTPDAALLEIDRALAFDHAA
ncbi:MAG: aminodeoxychorismate synthase component I, partial [Microterricola sp.]